MNFSKLSYEQINGIADQLSSKSESMRELLEQVTNLFNKIGKFAGAGSLVPITGFANSIVSPAMEYKSEGYVMGVGAKMFTVAGPVLVYGISTSVIVGLLYLLFNVQSITLV